jgi:hypothetical protein
MGARFMDLPDEASSVVPEAAVATVAALGEFARRVSEDGQSFVYTSVNPLTRKLFGLSLIIFSAYFVLTYAIGVAVHARGSHARKLKRI